LCDYYVIIIAIAIAIAIARERKRKKVIWYDMIVEVV